MIPPGTSLGQPPPSQVVFPSHRGVLPKDADELYTHAGVELSGFAKIENPPWKPTDPLKTDGLEDENSRQRYGPLKKGHVHFAGEYSFFNVINLPGICFAGATNASRKPGIQNLFGKISKVLFLQMPLWDSKMDEKGADKNYEETALDSNRLCFGRWAII